MIRFITGLLAGVLVTSAAAADLYQVLGAADISPTLSPAAISASLVHVPADVAAAAGASERVRFPLPGGAAVDAVRQGAEARTHGDYVWRGAYVSPGGKQGQVTLTRKNGVIAALLLAPDGVYELTPVAGGHVLLQLDQARFPECGGGLEVPSVGTRAASNATRIPLPGFVPTTGQVRAATAAAVIDVMVLYTPQARDAAGGVANIEATAQAAVDNANTAFANSKVAAQFNLVHTALANHNDAGNMNTDLVWVDGDATVAALRTQVGADLVSLLVENGAGFCGLGYVMRDVGPTFAPDAFQVTARTCAVGNLSYAHEHGHNLGLEHDPANGPASGDASYPWSFGHFVNGSFRTVMSYASQCAQGCTRVAYFSNPSINYNGQPTGIVDQRDNARTLRAGDSGTGTTVVAAAFLAAPSVIFGDGFESGDLSAWSFSAP